MSTTQQFSASTNKFAYAQVFSGSQSRQSLHRPTLRARLAARRVRRTAA